MIQSSNSVEIGAVLESMQRRLAAINANWNGQGPDLMTPTQAAAFKSEVLASYQDYGKLLVAVGGYAAGIGVGV
jgi:uncharacterized protein YukE